MIGLAVSGRLASAGPALAITRLRGMVLAAPRPAAVVVNASTPLWYLTRATGLVALVLLTASMALGLLSSVRY